MMPRRSFLLPSIACLLLISVATAPLFAQRKFDEREIKATFLFNFAQFVEWPAESFPDAGAPFVIGVLGEDPFGAILDEVVRGEATRNHPFVVTRFRRAEDISACHILFVSTSEAASYQSVFEALQGRPILTVGDGDGFASHGGMVRFITENKHVRLRINLGAARAARLTISSQLLRAAEVVGSGAGD
jgi:hypothetical protein